MMTPLLLIAGLGGLTLAGWLWRRRRRVTASYVSTHWLEEHLYGRGKNGH
jgi:LPXTG-motif cell wall-anchored protein